ncbi:MAG: GFA family protein [Betaproteobacteria bacterium]|nr:MAG: GFA family protein [Betaproteobacteria bacterium]
MTGFRLLLRPAHRRKQSAKFKVFAYFVPFAMRRGQNRTVRSPVVAGIAKSTPGAAVSISIGAPEKILRSHGLIPSVYEDKSSSGFVVLRTLCPDCGTSLFTENGSEPILILVNAGTLDDDASVQPRVFHRAAKYQWQGRLARHERRPPQILGWPEDELPVKASCVRNFNSPSALPDANARL